MKKNLQLLLVFLFYIQIPLKAASNSKTKPDNSFGVISPGKKGCDCMKNTGMANAIDNLRLETKNYNVFGDLLLESKRKDEERLDTKRSDKELIAEFTSCLIAKDLNALANLLDHSGVFMVINKTFETVAVIKEQYVNWLRFKLQTESVTQVDMDNCTGCSLGKTVVIYNNGKFPWVANNSGDSVKGGLDFKIANGKITQIKFCYKFKNTKNQFGFEKRYDIYKAYIDKGYSKAEADRLSDEEWKR